MRPSFVPRLARASVLPQLAAYAVLPMSESTSQSLQERFAPRGACFGCGPANPDGLRIRSFVQGDEVVCTWQPKTMHEAFPGMLNGGIVGALLDCHCNWTAAWHLMQKLGMPLPPCTVTAQYSIVLRRPTPTNAPVLLRAKVVESTDDRAKIAGTLEAGGKVCANCEGLFVAV
jgi:acyl-coenzyme A thioesterase PaaI-like protein